MIAKFSENLRNLIQYNFPIKVMALLVAVVLWVLVMNDQNPPVENSISVSLSAVNAPPGNKITYEDRAKVLVRAPRSFFASYDPDDFKAYVNLAGLGEGKHMVPVEVSVPQGFEFIEVQPGSLEVTLDPYVEMQFPPELIATGQVASGYTVAEMRPSSRTVGVVGPKSIVESVTRVIGYVNLMDNASASFTAMVPMIAVNEDAETVKGARVHPSNIEVDVSLARGVFKKILPIRVDFADDLPGDYEISNVRVAPVQMEVAGDEKLIRSLTEIHTDKISFANTAITGDVISRVVRLNLPEGVVAASNPNVVVEIEVRKKPQEKTETPAAAGTEMPEKAGNNKKEGN
ncbi:MAG: hypothetical protein IKR28_09355 [Selenomonadaceae bacterium]|nr:hypothetical protein [Selenomonadaceae bacterium]